jgi:hypothetical protein
VASSPTGLAPEGALGFQGAAQGEAAGLHAHPRRHDGQAELNGYRWSGARYGELRAGQAVMVFVTEPFSESKRVKVNDHTVNPDDVVDVLKLNLVRDFQTGIYDYNTMVSVFVRSGDFSPVKTTFSSAEWCGHVYGEQWLDGHELREQYFSYFEDETGNSTLDWKTGGITEESLFILLRGLRGDSMAPGEKKSFPFLPGKFYRRLAHRDLAWTTIEITRLEDGQNVTVPAGTFEVMTYLLMTQDGRVGEFAIERDYPHHIVKWSWSRATASGPSGETGELTGTARLEYWGLNKNGHESYLEELGLKPLPQN